MASNYNIGPRIGIEGEREFRQQISRINAEYKGMDSYIKALDKSMELHGRTQETLASRSNALRQQIGLQEQKFKELSDALIKARDKYDDNSQEVLRFEGALLDVKNTTAALQRELDDTDRELQRMAEGLDDVGDAADTADDKLLSFGDIVKAGIASGAILGTLERVGDVIVDVGAQAIDAAADVKAANAQFSQTFGNLEGTAKNALRSISNETGIATTRLQGGYTALYAFTKSVGSDSDTALNIAQRALSAAADSAAYYDRTMEDATETLQSFLKGNYENDAALGIAATETTRNAKANELYAKSFNELSEAQKVDTLLAMVEAGNAASGALGQAAREADSWTNVTGELNEAWRQMLAQLGGPIMEGLTPMIQGITDALKGMTEQTSWETLDQGIADFRTGLEAADEALQSSTTSIAATSNLAQRYVDRLRALEWAGLDTAEAQREYAQTVELLNTLMPELGLTINEVTGRLDQNTWAIEDNIRSLRDQAEQQAKMAYYKDILTEYEDAYKAQFTAEMQLIELQSKKKILMDQLAVANAEYTATLGGSTEAQVREKVHVDELNAAIASLSLEEKALTESLDAANIALAESAVKLERAEEGHADLAGATGDATAAVDEQSEAVAALAETYETAKAKARESIDSQIGLFDELVEDSEMSAEEIVANWEKQADAILNYNDNLRKAIDMGLAPELLAQLSDGSMQSMQAVDALVNSAEIGVDKINAAYGERLKADELLSSTMAVAVLATDAEYQRLETLLENDSQHVMEGAARGIRNNAWRLEQALGETADLGNKAYRMGWTINSPSRKMEENSDYIIDGAVLQLVRRTPDLEKAMANLARAGNAAYLQEQLDYTAQYSSMVGGSPGFLGGTTTHNNSVAYGGISITINAQPGQDAQSIADAVLQELTVRLGQEEAAFG